jgi:hypothetical protein
MSRALILFILVSMPLAVSAQESLYLPPAQALGSRWCFNPDDPGWAELDKQTRPKPDDLVDAPSLAADLPLLQELLRTSYPGYAVLAQSPPFDVEAFFRKWRQSLRGKKSVRVADAVIAPFRTLREEIVDQHFSPWVDSEALTGGSLLRPRELQVELAAGDAPDLARCSIDGARRVYASTLRRAQLLDGRGAHPIVTVSAVAENPVTLRCADRSWTLQPRAEAHAPPRGASDLPYTWSTIGDTAVIRVASFWGTVAQFENLGRLAQDYSEHARSRRIVFDLRGNGGGNDSPVYDWIARAKDGVWFSGAEVARIGQLSPCEEWNQLVDRQVQEHIQATAASKAARAAVRARWPTRLPETRDRFDAGLIHDHAAHPFKGPIYVVEDHDSMSSGETAAFVLRQALGAILVGERTGGYLDYGNVSSVVLPASHLRVNMPTKRNWYGAPMEAVGLDVDYYLRDVELPVRDLLPLFDRLEQNRAPRK